MLKMCNPKIKIILKEKPGKPSFEPHEKMKLNMDFSNNSIRFNLVPVLSSIKWPKVLVESKVPLT